MITLTHPNPPNPNPYPKCLGPGLQAYISIYVEFYNVLCSTIHTTRQSRGEHNCGRYSILSIFTLYDIAIACTLYAIIDSVSRCLGKVQHSLSHTPHTLCSACTTWHTCTHIALGHHHRSTKLIVVLLQYRYSSSRFSFTSNTIDINK